jgi:hypothetical protein
MNLTWRYYENQMDCIANDGIDDGASYNSLLLGIIQRQHSSFYN